MTSDQSRPPSDFRTALEIFGRSMSLDPVQLRRTGEDLIAIAETISSHDPYVRPCEGRSSVLTTDERLANLASSMYQSRRKRSAHFPADLFAEPAWDMLLDLFIAAVRRQRITVSSVCIASAVPPTTALRWIATLEEDNLVERIPVANDRRATEVRLTLKGHKAMRQSLIDWVPLTAI